jgi:hypothetical protein
MAVGLHVIHVLGHIEANSLIAQTSGRQSAESTKNGTKTGSNILHVSPMKLVQQLHSQRAASKSPLSQVRVQESL